MSAAPFRRSARAVYSVNVTASNFITLDTNVTNSPCTFIVDTGADVSIFKPNNISVNLIYDPQNQSVLRGITNQEILSLGSVNINLVSNNLNLPHSFQLVDNSFPIPTDGILGRDFLANYRCNIDYDSWLLTVNIHNNATIIPIQNNSNGTIVLPARSEVIRHVSNLNLDKDVLVESSEIAPGVFCSNTIVSKITPCVRIVNTNDKNIILNNFKPQVKPLENFHIFNLKNNNTPDRNNSLEKELNLTNVPNTIRTPLQKLCREYNDIFCLQDDLLTCNNFYKQKIKVQDETPVYIKNYRNAHSQRDEICSQIDKLIDNDIIEPSVSSYNSPILLVPKKSATSEKKWRLVVDYRQLNKKLLADKFPLPRIDDILDQLGRAKYFTTLDLMSGFHQIEIEKNSREFTAFSLPERGHFQFKRLPFGLNISPNSFQRMMSIALSGLSPECAFLYIDDVIVVGCSIEHHLKNLRKVFQCFRERNLKLNPSKCCFFQPEVTFLGHKITDKGILPDNSKFDVIKNYPTPQNADQVRSFVAMCNYYRRFIPNFATICNCLNKLLRKNVKFSWTRDCQEAFDKLKHNLLSPKILQYPDFGKTFIVTTDASDFACGAVLSQKHENDDLPISFASRAFTKGERNKHIIEKELAAIHWAILHYRPYLLGRKFIVRTDHRPLVYLFGMKNPSSKLTRMRLELEEFDFQVEFVPGKSNVVADALSRININSEELKNMNILQVRTRSMASKPCTAKCNEIQNEKKPDHLHIYEATNNEEIYKLRKVAFTILQNKKLPVVNINVFDNNYKNGLTLALALELSLTNLKNLFQLINDYFSQLKSENTIAISKNDAIFNYISLNDFKNTGNKILKTVTIVVFDPPKLISDKTEIQKLLEHHHSSPTGGHIGISRLYKKLKNSYIFPNMKHVVSKFVKACELCKVNKHFSPVKENMVKTTTPIKTFDVVSIDTIGPFSLTPNGNRYAVTIQCDLSKYTIIVPIPDKSASTISKAIVENCILVFGPMSAIRTDQGTEYKGIFDNICELLKINHTCSTAYHPQTIGSLERNHRCLNEYLRSFINDLKTDWDTWLSYYSYCYNTTPNSAHAYSPFEILFGKPINKFENINWNSVEPLYNHDSYLQELKYKLQIIHSYVFKKIEETKVIRTQKNNNNINPTNLNPNDTVYLKIEGRRKLDTVQDGPYTVIKLDGSNAEIKHQIKNQTQIVHKTRLVKHKNA